MLSSHPIDHYCQLETNNTNFIINHNSSPPEPQPRDQFAAAAAAAAAADHLKLLQGAQSQELLLLSQNQLDLLKLNLQPDISYYPRRDLQSGPVEGEARAAVQFGTLGGEGGGRRKFEVASPNVYQVDKNNNKNINSNAKLIKALIDRQSSFLTKSFIGANVRAANGRSSLPAKNRHKHARHHQHLKWKSTTTINNNKYYTANANNARFSKQHLVNMAPNADKINFPVNNEAKQAGQAGRSEPHGEVVNNPNNQANTYQQQQSFTNGRQQTFKRPHFQSTIELADEQELYYNQQQAFNDFRVNQQLESCSNPSNSFTLNTNYQVAHFPPASSSSSAILSNTNFLPRSNKMIKTKHKDYPRTSYQAHHHHPQQQTNFAQLYSNFSINDPIVQQQNQDQTIQNNYTKLTGLTNHMSPNSSPVKLLANFQGPSNKSLRDYKIESDTTRTTTVTVNNDTTKNLVQSVEDLPIFINVENNRYTSYSMSGEPYICLPQLLQYLREKFSLRRMIELFEESMIQFTEATPKQIEGFIKASVLPANACSCPLIKRSDTDKICLALHEQCYKGKRNNIVNICSSDQTSPQSPSIKELSSPVDHVKLKKQFQDDDSQIVECIKEEQSKNIYQRGNPKTASQLLEDDIKIDTSDSSLNLDEDKKSIYDTITATISPDTPSALKQADDSSRSTTTTSNMIAITNKKPLFDSEAQSSILSLARAVTSTLIIRVYHRCFGKCAGLYYPSLLYSKKSICIECTSCHIMLSPRRFIGHTHGTKENNVTHWGFNSYNWPHYIKLSRKQTMNNLDEEELLNQFRILQASAEHLEKRELSGSLDDSDYEFDQPDFWPSSSSSINTSSNIRASSTGNKDPSATFKSCLSQPHLQQQQSLSSSQQEQLLQQQQIQFQNQHQLQQLSSPLSERELKREIYICNNLATYLGNRGLNSNTIQDILENTLMIVRRSNSIF